MRKHLWCLSSQIETAEEEQKKRKIVSRKRIKNMEIIYLKNTELRATAAVVAVAAAASVTAILALAQY